MDGNYDGITHVLEGINLNLAEGVPSAVDMDSRLAYEPLKGEIKVAWLKQAALTLETVAHLRGLERELLPQADALRYIAKEWE